MRTVVLVPRRAGDPQRDRVWRWVLNWWNAQLPELGPPVSAEHTNGPFNRAAAINAAAEVAGDWDVAVIADADSVTDPAAVRAAIDRADAAWRMVIAYERFAHLTRAMTENILNGYAGSWEAGVDWTLTGTCSSMIAVPRALWDAVGGFDERFVGWGMEDVAFATATSAFACGQDRLRGTLWHLWHRPAQRDPALEEANVALLARYAAAADNPDAMQALCHESRAAVRQ